MTTNVIVPAMGESITEATVARWLKNPGDAVAQDEALVELETDKVTLEVNAPVAGVLKEVKAAAGSTVSVGAVIGVVDEAAAGKGAAAPLKAAAPVPVAPVAPVAAVSSAPIFSPAAQKIATENALSSVSGSGKDGRVTKGDVLSALEGKKAGGASAVVAAVRGEERVKMTKLRQRIAQRLKESQNVNATLTTFNDVDFTNVLEMRNRYKDDFEKKHGVKLGFMSFFVKAAVTALKEIPEVNAQIDGDEIVYKNYYDIGVAVGTPQGLVVPVVRNADQMSLADIEREIGNLAKKARDGKLTMEEMTGGSFTITNGGVYGSLLATPIINPPQSAILGMNRMEERAVVRNGQIVARPMMYIALSYDHRIIDGRESVTFLKRIKECVENPERMLLAL